MTSESHIEQVPVARPSQMTTRDLVIVRAAIITVLDDGRRSRETAETIRCLHCSHNIKVIASNNGTHLAQHGKCKGSNSPIRGDWRNDSTFKLIEQSTGRIVDARPWKFYAENWREDSDESNAERLAFVDAIQSEILKRLREGEVTA